MSPIQSAVAALLAGDPPTRPGAAVWELLRLHLPPGDLPAPDDMRALGGKFPTRLPSSWPPTSRRCGTPEAAPPAV